ncbi:hypothetical protein FHX75_11152 [Micromonospora palomenae]|uniref:Uncharacterized protein n=1 Tax=Micromonospora palomenae TaxID=1461247 RepID=A0A561WT36_9ACTN|nr:hypothetical protein [Micromonospora palomenae]TWG27017.1 hypothetical protein FHX75_11152 [Micromonospora palomenae]
MVFRTWRNLLLTALGMGVLAGAGQLGIAFGFGMVQLTGASTGATVNQWPAQLVWVGWFAAHAAVAGTVVTARLARRYGVLGSTGRLVAVAAAAALGATVVAPLWVRPAQAAERFSVDPIWAVGICATLGALVGAGAAIAVVVKPPLGWNMAAVGGVVWLLALVSVVPSLATAGPLPAVRLGVLEPAGLDADMAHRPAFLILPAVALLIGAATGGLARWRGHPPLVNGATGTAGTVLVAFAYLTAGPGDAVDRYQITPYYGALLAVAAGVLGSAAAALFRWPLLPRTAEARVVEPTDILGPLSAGPAVPQAMTPAAGGTTDEPEPVDLAGTGPVASATAAKLPTAAEPLGFGAPAGDRDASAVPADSATRTAAPAVTAVPADLATPADLDDTPETSEPAPATAAHLPAGPGGDGSGTAEAEADNTEPAAMPPDGALVAPGTRRMYQPPKTDRTRIQATWPVVPARRVPPSTEPAPGAEATHSAGTQERPEPALPPRHRPPLPDLNRAANWDALATAQRAGPPPTTDAAPAAPASVVEAGRASGRASGRLGLFRRNKSRADGNGAGTPADGEPLPSQDAEFVDWVTQLGKPVADSEPDRPQLGPMPLGSVRSR